MNKIETEKIIIAGPCAVESRELVMQSAEEALSRGIQRVRLSLWKPRTKPDFEGVGKTGIPWLVEVAQMGLTPATEVLSAEHANSVIDAVIKNTDARVLLWLGSRNQNHFIQREIGMVVAGEPKVDLMIKNQPWQDKSHWEGIIEHVISGGANEKQLLICHRGFSPSSNGFRNDPDFEMALSIKKNTGLPMLLDFSHIAGSVPKVFKLAEAGSMSGFDGLIIEVHPNPAQALTDKNQQLSWEQFDCLLGKL